MLPQSLAFPYRLNRSHCLTGDSKLLLRNDHVSDKFFCARRRQKVLPRAIHHYYSACLLTSVVTRQAFSAWKACAMLATELATTLADQHFINATMHRTRAIYCHWAKEAHRAPSRSCLLLHALLTPYPKVDALVILPWAPRR